ncbi:hypothetical protein D3C80_1864890 [compost metagenome]
MQAGHCQRASQPLSVATSFNHAPAEAGAAFAAVPEAATGHHLALDLDHLECALRGVFMQEALEVTSLLGAEIGGHVAVED